MVMGMFMGCGPRDSKSYPFESQFKRVVLHESTRSMHKSWSQEVANSPLSLSVETETMEVSAMEAARRFEKENILEKVTNRERRHEGSL